MMPELSSLTKLDELLELRLLVEEDEDELLVELLDENDELLEDELLNSSTNGNATSDNVTSGIETSGIASH